MESCSIPILVVDDDRLVADMLIDILQLCGFEAIPAYSGMEALAVLNSWRPKVVFLDIRMPGLDGYETAKAIRALPEQENVAIVALSGWHGREGRSPEEYALFNGYLVKPTGIETITTVIHSVLADQASASPPAALHFC